jgi:hypothetical protein
MKRRWVIVAVTSMALIFAGVIVRTQRKNRQLANRAAAYRVLAEQGDAKSQFARSASTSLSRAGARSFMRPSTGVRR